jgi:hypothetical protein
MSRGFLKWGVIQNFAKRGDNKEKRGEESNEEDGRNEEKMG